MRHQVIAATDLTGSLSPTVPCVPVKPTPATRPHADLSGTLSAKPVPLPSLLPTPPSPPPTARSQFPELAACATFDAAVAASSVYSQPNISAKADAAGRRLLAAGLGVDQTLVATHVEHIAHHGLRHLLQQCSDQLRHRTLRPVSQRRDPPSTSTPLFPVRPAPATTDQPSAPIPPPLAAVAKPGDTELEPPDPQLYSNLELFDPVLTRDEKFQLVAEHGAPILLRRDFAPNGCEGVDVLPPSIAPPAAIEAHFAKEQRKGLSVILPLRLVQACCAAEGLSLCGSKQCLHRR